MKNFFEKLSWQIVFAAYLAIFFLRNLLTPNVADDYSYKFIWDGAGIGNLLNSLDSERLQRVESFWDILYSQWQHYFTWGGRTVAHIFVQFFAWHDKIFFDVATVFVFAALVLLLFKVGTGLPLREMNKSYLLFILAGIYFCAPSLMITTIWMTGAVNYLWMCTLIILFLLPFALTYWNPQKSLNIAHYSLLIAFPVGWSSESGAAVAIFITFLFLIHFYREKNLQSWMKISFVLLLIGFAFLMFAPGNIHRMEMIHAGKAPLEYMFRANFYEGFFPVLKGEAILFAPIIFYFVKVRTSPKVSRFIGTFAAAAVLALMVMMCSPIFPERAGFPSTIFLMVASVAALKEILPLVKNFCRLHMKFTMLATIIFSAVWLTNLAGCLYVEYSFNSQIAERFKIIAAHKNDDLIVVPPIKLPPWSEKYLGSRTWNKFALLVGADLKPFYFNNRNLTFCRYHGLKKIVAKRNFN